LTHRAPRRQDGNDERLTSAARLFCRRLDQKERTLPSLHLIAIFENPGLDFSKNRADGDDLLGDAYEYLMRHFATESGKSKGQFYTPAEVSRIIAQILGIRSAKVGGSRVRSVTALCPGGRNSDRPRRAGDRSGNVMCSQNWQNQRWGAG
jgi:hypothetical protein